MGLRITVLAVPPVIPLLHRDLHLTQTGVGLLTALPSLMFALAAVPGSVLISRFGSVQTLVSGLFLTALASALRGAAHNAAVLYATTFFMGAGISIMQPALPRVVREWLPERVAFGTAVYSNGLLVGNLVAAWLTVPIILPLTGGSWRLGLLFWSFPVFATAFLVAARGPRATGFATSCVLRSGWSPNWKNPLIWRLGFILGCVNSLYFGTNFFLPDYLHHTSQAHLITSALAALNLCQMPASFLLLALAGRLTTRSSSYLIAGALTAAGIVGLLVGRHAFIIVASAGLIGFTTTALLILILALPPLLAKPDEVHRVSAGIFTISYSCAVVVPIVSGFIWDATGIAWSVFLPFGLCAVSIIVLSFGLRLRRHST